MFPPSEPEIFAPVLTHSKQRTAEPAVLAGTCRGLESGLWFLAGSTDALVACAISFAHLAAETGKI